MTERSVASRFRLDGVVATIDAAAGQNTLDRQPEAVKQAAVADRLLLTKTDLVDKKAVRALEKRLRVLNPAAPLLRVLNGAVEPAALFDAGLYDPRTKSLDVQRWLNAEAYKAHHPHSHEGHGHHHQHDVNRHDDHITAACFTFDEPLAADPLELWLRSLLLLKGPDLLRVKGILNVAGLSGPVVIHGVQHIFHPPEVLKAWPSADRRSRIVFITRDFDESMLRDTMTFLLDDEEHGG